MKKTNTLIKEPLIASVGNYMYIYPLFLFHGGDLLIWYSVLYIEPIIADGAIKYNNFVLSA